jgi:hypothetical protein
MDNLPRYPVDGVCDAPLTIGARTPARVPLRPCIRIIRDDYAETRVRTAMPSSGFAGEPL